VILQVVLGPGIAGAVVRGGALVIVVQVVKGGVAVEEEAEEEELAGLLGVVGVLRLLGCLLAEHVV
jgi:hypothetical protein